MIAREKENNVGEQRFSFIKFKTRLSWQFCASLNDVWTHKQKNQLHTLDFIVCIVFEWTENIWNLKQGAKNTYNIEYAYQALSNYYRWKLGFLSFGY